VKRWRGVLASEHADVLRESVALMVREMMELEVSRLAGAELGERAPERRTAQRNGYRERRWDTRVWEIESQIPRLRTGSYLPSFLEPRRRAEPGAGRGRPGGVCQRCEHSEGRSAGRANGAAWALEGSGLPDVPRVDSEPPTRESGSRAGDCFDLLSASRAGDRIGDQT
jgi:hypothetical protein